MATGDVQRRVTTALFVVLLPVMQTAWAQAQRTIPPHFEDYPVADAASRKAPAPQWISRIEGVPLIEHGPTKMVLEAGPNFAGHYVVQQWTCGSPCVMMAIVDVVTGHVYHPPISSGSGVQKFNLGVEFYPVPDDPEKAVARAARAEFRADSYLMIVKANPDPTRSRENYTHYFLWRNNRWKLLSRTPLKEETP